MMNNHLADSLYTIPITTIDNKETTLEPYRGKVLLIVNVASRCGFTAQYSALENLYRKYKTCGFSVLGFPCNQFLQQEPGSNQEIKNFASSCFHVSFPLFAKVSVKGKQQSPLYAFLAKNIQKKPWLFVPWNFTKILVSADGKVLKQYAPFTSIKTIEKKLKKLLMLPHNY